MNLQALLKKDETAALVRLAQDLGGRLLRPLAQAWGRAGQEVLGNAVRGRFTGKGPFPVSQHRLGVVTNRLRRSMRATLPAIDGGTIRVSMGSNVSYYEGHEFGFRGRVQVRSHTRRATAAGKLRPHRGKLTKAGTAALKDRYARGRSNYQNVRAHTRRVAIPARRPLGTELAAIKTRLTFRKAITGVIRLLTSRNSSAS